MKEKTVFDLKALLDSKEDFQLIDVREDYEIEVADIGGDKIPMGEVPTSLEKISRSKPVIIYCRSGNRSRNVCHFLETNHGFTNIYNLKGGILAWAGDIDPTMSKY